MKILMVCLLGLMLTGGAAMPVNKPLSASNTICMGVCFSDSWCFGDCICVQRFRGVEGFCWNPNRHSDVLPGHLELDSGYAFCQRE